MLLEDEENLEMVFDVGDGIELIERFKKQLTIFDKF
jgi:hypothetical protein